MQAVSDWETIAKVQKECGAAMEVWGFVETNASTVVSDPVLTLAPFTGL